MMLLNAAANERAPITPDDRQTTNHFLLTKPHDKAVRFKGLYFVNGKVGDMSCTQDMHLDLLTGQFSAQVGL